MKKTIFFASVLVAFSMIFSCQPEECQEGYERVNHENGSTCLPILTGGMKYNPNLGNIYYHEKHGVITFKNNKWYNEHQTEISLKN